MGSLLADSLRTMPSFREEKQLGGLIFRNLGVFKCSFPIQVECFWASAWSALNRLRVSLTGWKNQRCWRLEGMDKQITRLVYRFFSRMNLLWRSERRRLFSLDSGENLSFRSACAVCMRRPSLVRSYVMVADWTVFFSKNALSYRDSICLIHLF